MKILYLTKYTQLAASSRMRSFQYFPYFEKEGIQITVKPFFDNVYIQNLYAGKTSKLTILKAYWKRFFVLFTIGSFDKIVIEKELFPYLPAWVEQLLNFLNIHYIVDYDDAIFHNYDQHPHPFFRKLLKNKIAVVMKNSDTVVAGNEYLANYAEMAGAKKIVIIPTAIDIDRYSIQEKKENNPFIFGWIGTKSTFEKHLAPCQTWIVEFLEEHPQTEFHIIGIPSDLGWHKRVKWNPWTEDSEVSSILKLDVGIMPLKDSLWERGKCAYKLIQYGACGIPGIASDVGMNKEVTISGETGFLVQTNQEWIHYLEELKNNADERQNLGENARKMVEDKYSIQVTVKKWMEIFKGSISRDTSSS